MADYRKKPVVIQAVQFTGHNEDEIRTLMGNRSPMLTHIPGALIIGTLEGQMRADPGDWIIKGVKSEFYPCKDDVFRATYDPA